MPNVYLVVSGKRTRYTDRFRGLLISAMQVLSIHDALEISLRFLNRSTISDLNASYRHLAGPTDTITFALEDTAAFIRPPDLDVRVLGDMYLCLPQIRENAKKAGTAFDHELDLVFVHSVLHLLGYDHQTDQDYDTMMKLTETILLFQTNGPSR